MQSFSRRECFNQPETKYVPRARLHREIIFGAISRISRTFDDSNSAKKLKTLFSKRDRQESSVKLI
jgi:hypothetical protein